MNDFDFTFEETPWELTLDSLRRGDKLSAARFLTLMEGEGETEVEDALLDLEMGGVMLDLTGLPAPAMSGDSGLRLKREADLVRQGTLLDSLEKTDPLRLYLEEVAAIPVCGDIRLMAEQLGRANLVQAENENLRMAVVNLSLSRVIELAGKYTGWGVLLLDLIQEGSLGLWKAALCYAGKGEDFERIRDWWIEQYMIRAIVMQARANGVGQRMRQALEDYRSVDERLLSDLGRNPTLEEVAVEMHMSVEDTAVVKSMLDSARLMHKAKADSEPKEETEDDERHVEDTAYFQMRQRISDLLSGLGQEDVKLLTLRFGLEGGMPLSPEDTGRKLGLTPEEVVAREAAALAQLRSN